MTALLINPVEKTVTRVPVVQDYRAILKYTGCDTLGTFPLGPEVVGYCDDEGRLKPNQKCTTFPNLYEHPVAGNIYICGFNHAGDNRGLSEAKVQEIENSAFFLPDDFDYTPGQPVIVSFNTMEEMMSYIFKGGK